MSLLRLCFYFSFTIAVSIVTTRCVKCFFNVLCEIVSRLARRFEFSFTVLELGFLFDLEQLSFWVDNLNAADLFVEINPDIINDYVENHLKILLKDVGVEFVLFHQIKLIGILITVLGHVDEFLGLILTILLGLWTHALF